MTSMSEAIDHDRRRLVSTAAMALASAQIGIMGWARAQETKPKQLPAIKPGTNTSLGSLKQINAGLLNVGYAEAGPENGPVVVLLHGWPYDIHSFVDVAPVLAGAGYRVIIPYLRGYGTTRFLSSEAVRNGQPAALWPQRCKAMVSVSGYLIGNQEAGKLPSPPKAELDFWYQYYFATERGRAGYEKYRREFSKLIWQTASPKWAFDDATFDRSAAAFNNPDHVDIVIHNYRWRLALVQGESKYDELEKRLAQSPVITVPTITMEGDANGAFHLDPAAYARKFSGPYEHRNLTGGIGHNLPQEAPQAFAQAVVDVASF
jgi:pimeloyl-ACP methyl ester carboxylesterase